LAIKLFLIAFCSVISVGSAASDFSDIDNIIQEAKTRSDMQSGTAVVVIKNDRIIHEAYFGNADIAAGRGVDEQTVFYIASTTKAFLAQAVLLAEAQGDISTETTLQELFPDIVFEQIDANTITVKHLLTHTSGIDNESLTWAASYTGLHDNASRHAMIAGSYPSAGAKLGVFEYSNVGYNILAVWFDDYYGRDWRDTLEDTILKPLEMNTSTGFISEGESSGWPLTQPYSYKVGGGKVPLYLRKTDNTMYSVGLIATTRDTARFLMAQMNDGVINGNQIFPAKVIQKQRKLQVATDGGYFDGYALGWMTSNHEGRAKRLHTGGFSGASALLSYLPKEKVGIVVLQNENGLKANYLNGIIEDVVYGHLLGKTKAEIASIAKPTLERLVTRTKRAKQDLAEAMIARESAHWQLSLNIKDYIGTYSHPFSGTIEVKMNADSRFDIRWGLLHGTGYPHTNIDTIEAELRPGSFDPVFFGVSETEVNFIEFNSVRFVKDP
jgi:CubicO group peptidase (beta-lactamase class C family)